jgi:hypothetical protein
MVLNLQVWLPEGVVCWMTDRKEAVSVEQHVCVCVCCLYWNCLFIDRQLVLRLQLRKLKRMARNSWWEYGTLQEQRGNGVNRTLNCCDRSASQCGVKIMCFVETETFCTSRCAHVLVWSAIVSLVCNVLWLASIHPLMEAFCCLCANWSWQYELMLLCLCCVLKFVALSWSILAIETRYFLCKGIVFSFLFLCRLIYKQ